MVDCDVTSFLTDDKMKKTMMHDEKFYGSGIMFGNEERNKILLHFGGLIHSYFRSNLKSR